MAEEDGLTYAGEFYPGEAGEKLRVGPRMNVADLSGRRKTRTPQRIALRKLQTLLDVGEISRDVKIKYISLLRDSQQLRFMNMQVLATTIIYLQRLPRKIVNGIPEIDFNSITYESMLPYIDQLFEIFKIRDITDNERMAMRLRMSATFVRYILYLITIEREKKNAVATAGSEFDYLEE